MMSVEIPNGSLKQYYYDVQYCYERALDVSECIDYLIELQGESE